MRIVAGKYGSRVLAGPRGTALRPTSDRLRETLFNILGAAVVGSVFVDLYAGTGAVGIEALSRGARRVVFIEEHRATVALIRKNLAALEIRDGFEVLAADAVRGIERLTAEGERADFVFLDPPYAATQEHERTLQLLGRGLLLDSAGCVIVEHQKRHRLSELYGRLELARVVKQGDSALSFFRHREFPE